MKNELAELKIPYFKMLLSSTEEKGFLRRYLERMIMSYYTLGLWITHGRMCVAYSRKDWDCPTELHHTYHTVSALIWPQWMLQAYTMYGWGFCTVWCGWPMTRRLSQSNSSLTALPWRSISHLYALGLVFQNTQLEWKYSAWENTALSHNSCSLIRRLRACEEKVTGRWAFGPQLLPGKPRCSFLLEEQRTRNSE